MRVVGLGWWPGALGHKVSWWLICPQVLSTAPQTCMTCHSLSHSFIHSTTLSEHGCGHKEVRTACPARAQASRGQFWRPWLTPTPVPRSLGSALRPLMQHEPLPHTGQGFTHRKSHPCGSCPPLPSLGTSPTISQSHMDPPSPCQGCHCPFHRGDTDGNGHTGATLPSSEPGQPWEKCPQDNRWVHAGNRKQWQVWRWGTWPGPICPSVPLSSPLPPGHCCRPGPGKPCVRWGKGTVASSTANQITKDQNSLGQKGPGGGEGRIGECSGPWWKGEEVTA